MTGTSKKIIFLNFLDLYFLFFCSGLPPRWGVQPDAVFNRCVKLGKQFCDKVYLDSDDTVLKLFDCSKPLKAYKTSKIFGQKKSQNSLKVQSYKFTNFSNEKGKGKIIFKTNSWPEKRMRAWAGLPEESMSNLINK